MNEAARQKKLADLGYAVGPIDGIRGKRTIAAMLAFAEDELDGMIAVAPPVMPPEDIDPRAIALIKEFEGFRGVAYRDPAGIWTIGYGTTAAAGVGIEPGPGMKITEDEAESFLFRALGKFAAAIRPMITAPITPAEFGAFLSLAYNIGPAAFAGSAALRHFNAGNKHYAADAILNWIRAGGRVLEGLKRRRAAERALFLQD